MWKEQLDSTNEELDGDGTECQFGYEEMVELGDIL